MARFIVKSNEEVVVHLRGRVPEMLDHDIYQVEITEDRRTKERLRNGHDSIMRKTIMREKPAYVRRVRTKADAKRRVPAERQMTELRKGRELSIKLAADITRYVDRNGGEIMGVSLTEIYAEFAQVFLQNASRQSIERIGGAVQYAIAKGWLEEKEAGCVFKIPVHAPAA